MEASPHPPPSEYFPAERLSHRILQAREDQKLTQKELAALAAISVGTLIGIEAGKRTAGFDTIERVLKALGLSLWIK